MSQFFRSTLVVIVVLLTSELVAEDQQPIDISRDWSTFDCYIVSGAIEMLAFKNGEKLSKVSRDKGRLYVQKNNDDSGQVAGTYFAGFPLKTASQALLSIDGKDSFVLYSHPDPDPKKSSEKSYAWSHPKDDKKLMAALKKGSKAVVESNSHTGKVIKDTFALTGFTSAYNLMLKTCN